MAVTMVAIFGYPRSLTYRRKSLFIPVVIFYLRACNKVLSGIRAAEADHVGEQNSFLGLELSDCNLRPGLKTDSANSCFDLAWDDGMNMTSRAEHS